MNKILVFVPTYEEVENVRPLCEQIMSLPLPLDLHFTDDASPDGTGEELERLARQYPRLSVSHRPGKQGIGSAHQEGIAYAYRNGYQILITMDCDFTHDPMKIPALLEARENYQVVLGSRYLQSDSLPGWTRGRSMLTKVGHFLTQNFLHMKYDATNAFRLYDLTTLPPALFQLVRSPGYSFFFESLFVLTRNNIRIREIPITLPNRLTGHSKLTLKEAMRSGKLLLKLTLENILHPKRFRLPSGTLANAGNAQPVTAGKPPPGQEKSENRGAAG
jgi:dolichol-phosphate mannosyltransferase